MPTVVIATLDIGGNVPPMLGIARELRRRGWRVLVHGDDILRARVEDAGATFVPTAARQVDPLQPRTSVASIADAMRSLTDRARAEEVLALVAEVGADVALIDVALVRVVGACTGAVPTAVLIHTMFDLVSPFLGRPYGPLLERIGIRAPGIIAAADRILVASPSVLDGTRPLTRNAVRTGGVLQDPPAVRERQGAPLVLVSLSSAWFPRQERLLQRIVDAVAGLEARVVVTTGRSVPPTAIHAPDGVEVHGVLDHGRVLPAASLVIGHGGHATTVRALAHGVPMVVVPLNPGSDQHRVGLAVGRIGAGLVVPKSATLGRLRAAAATVLRSPGFAAAAAAAGAAIQAENGAIQAADELDRLARRR
jgi:UDP:flavonoid glycosyltransferase YjiC (YdhE family)